MGCFAQALGAGVGCIGAAGLALACVAVAESAEVLAPDPEPTEPTVGARVPDAAEHPRETTVAAARWTSCDALVADAEGQVRRDLEALCGTDSHDGSCVGFACARTPPREAFECLLDAGQSDRVIALAKADVPAARAFAREAMTRTDMWTPERIDDALRDEVAVDSCDGCVCSSELLSDAGLNAALNHPDRAAVQPVLARWLASDPPASLATALYERGTEAWIDVAQLRRIYEVGRERKDEEVRVAAAYALAQRGESTPAADLYALAKSSSWWVRKLAVQTLDELDDARAWTKLSALLDDDTGWVRIALLRLGARLVPADAVKVIDADAFFGPYAASALPPHLFRDRAARTLCRWDPLNGEPAAGLQAALSALPRKTSCAALRGASCRDGSPEEASLRAFAVAPDLARACGLVESTVEPAWPYRPVDTAPDCHRRRDKEQHAEDAAERKRLLELEARAKAAAEAVR